MTINFRKQSGIYTMVAEQTVTASLEEMWDFFTLPKNLSKICPDNMEFKITNQPADLTYAGQIITYVIKIFPGVKTNWITEITHLHDREFFVDEQRIGPYKMWHHEHHFRELEDGRVKMTDIVNYKLPFGIFGTIIAGNIIEKKVRDIFECRFRKIEELFHNT